jgi:hypothetical protein
MNKRFIIVGIVLGAAIAAAVFWNYTFRTG